MNIFTFTGNLGRDCSTNNINGTAVANFVVGVKSGWGDKQQTLWMDCALWGKQAESGLVQYLTKGQRVSVSGELGTRDYQANDGTTKTALTCRVNSIDLEGSAAVPQQQPVQQQRQAPQPPVQQPQAPADEFSDDIPF